VRRNVVAAVVGGFALGQLAWLDPLFVPLVLAGPLATGGIAATRGIALRWVGLAWAVAGVTMLLSDWLVNHEDAAFHAVVTVLMVALAALGWWIGARFGRRVRAAG